MEAHWKLLLLVDFVGASPESIKSLCTDREGVLIGFVVTEVNAELEEKLQEKQKEMQKLASSAKAISSTFGDPMLEFDLLIDQLDTKPSAIQVRLAWYCFMTRRLQKRIDEWTAFAYAACCRFARNLSCGISICMSALARSSWRRWNRCTNPPKAARISCS